MVKLLLSSLVFLLAFIVAGCHTEPEPGTYCSTKVLSYEEMAQSTLNTHFVKKEK